MHLTITLREITHSLRMLFFLFCFVLFFGGGRGDIKKRINAFGLKIVVSRVKR